MSVTGEVHFDKSAFIEISIQFLNIKKILRISIVCRQYNLNGGEILYKLVKIKVNTIFKIDRIYILIKGYLSKFTKWIRILHDNFNIA